MKRTLTPWQQRACAVALIVLAPVLLALWLALGLVLGVVLVGAMLLGSADVSVTF
jgi:hypothetical protein